MASELKPCPFCGGKAVLEVFNDEGFKSYFVEARVRCPVCGATKPWVKIPLDVEKAKAEAVAAWNNRVGVSKTETTTGNMAKMREALNRIASVTADADLTDCQAREIAEDVANTALAEPVKNCEVGTPSEKSDRFFAFCNSHTCADCPCAKIDEDCLALWLQMPYEMKGVDDGSK